MREPSKDVDAVATKVIGAAIEVHKFLGPGYLESVYEEALCAELSLEGIAYRQQVAFSLDYKKHKIGKAGSTCWLETHWS